MLLLRVHQLELELVTSEMLSRKKDVRGWVVVRLWKMEKALDEHLLAQGVDDGPRRRLGAVVRVLMLPVEEVDVLVVGGDD